MSDKEATSATDEEHQRSLRFRSNFELIVSIGVSGLQNRYQQGVENVLVVASHVAPIRFSRLAQGALRGHGALSNQFLTFKTVADETRGFRESFRQDLCEETR